MFTLHGNVNTMTDTGVPRIPLKFLCIVRKNCLVCCCKCDKIKKPMLFDEKKKINWQLYFRFVLAPFINELTEENKIYYYFTQGNVTAHTVNFSTDALDEHGER